MPKIKYKVKVKYATCHAIHLCLSSWKAKASYAYELVAENVCFLVVIIT